MMGSSSIPPAKDGFEHIYRYFDKNLNVCIAKVKPGEFYVTENVEYIMTTLGSCISACIRDKELQFGGINHFMLPLKDNVYDKKNPVIASQAARYGNWAMEYLINEILKAGGKRRNLEIKLFGGANMMGQSGNVGNNNISFIKQYIYDENLTLLAEDLGENYARHILYNPKDGRVKLKKLVHDYSKVLAEEKSYMDSINQNKPKDDIELF